MEHEGDRTIEDDMLKNVHQHLYSIITAFVWLLALGVEQH